MKKLLLIAIITIMAASCTIGRTPCKKDPNRPYIHKCDEFLL